MFGDNFRKKFGGKPNEDEKEGYDPMGNMPPAKDVPLPEKEEEENPNEDEKEKKPESPEGEKSEEEAIEEILELFDQLTPLIEKLRNRK